MRNLVLVFTVFVLMAAAPAQREFDVDGPIELHIWLTAKSGQEAALEKTFREVFYPAVSRQDGFRAASLMRKPHTSDYTVRLSFDTEEQRMKWVKTDEHQSAWPALAAHCEEPKYDGFAVIHPK